LLIASSPFHALAEGWQDAPWIVSASIMTETAALVPLPPQPRDVPWPTQQWPRSEPHVRDATAFAPACNAVFELTPARGVTYALLVVQAGRLVYERYAAGARNLYLQYSWSMAKSITHALVGVACGKGLLDLDAPAAVPEWQGDGDPRRHITLDQLLKMRSGLAFNEDYVDGSVSDVIEMLQFSGRRDMGAYAASKPLVHPPGEHFYYSSGTTNIICRLLRDRIGGPSEMLAFMRDELFEPIGMHTPLPKFDHAGTFVGSSYCLATPQDFARFGYLYLRDGVWDGRRILPDGWVDYARRASYVDATQGYGAHWWLMPGTTRFYAGGYDGQRIIVAPEQDLVVVRCGRTPVDEMPHVTEQLNAMMGALE
jgi:CubicO group peptidase (beta-lactamase class C family)